MTESRRVALRLEFDGVDISQDINKYLLSMSYTDNEEEKADDLQIALEDQDGIWLNHWLNAESNGVKGAMLHAYLVQSGKDSILDCGLFELDSVEASGPPAKINLKGTSIPYTSTIRMQRKSKAWENIHLSTIVKEIAGSNSMQCLFDSTFNPFYNRREQLQQSDIVFLQVLCKAAGIALKVTTKTIVLFDEAVYEQKEPIKIIKYGESSVKTYKFSTRFNDTAYSSCHVSYTHPQKRNTIEYTYTPDSSTGTGQVLEVNEKVSSLNEARQLAIKRLRQKNKNECTADFTLVGDVDYVAGITVSVFGYGAFDGKYIVQSAKHNLTGGYSVSIKLRRVLEGY